MLAWCSALEHLHGARSLNVYTALLALFYFIFIFIFNLGFHLVSGQGQAGAKLPSLARFSSSRWPRSSRG